MRAQGADRRLLQSMARWWLLTMLRVQVDSSQWFDMSPAVNDTGRHIEGTDAAAPYVARYAAMLQGTHDAVAKNLDGRPSMVLFHLIPCLHHLLETQALLLAAQLHRECEGRMASVHTDLHPGSF